MKITLNTGSIKRSYFNREHRWNGIRLFLFIHRFPVAFQARFFILY